MTAMELLPCPFCGGEAELRHNKTWDYEVRCTNCRAKTRQHHENENGAVDDWNARAGVWTHILPCGHEVDTMGPEPPRHCKECGAKVVGE